MPGVCGLFNIGFVKGGRFTIETTQSCQKMAPDLDLILRPHLKHLPQWIHSSAARVNHWKG